MAIFISAVFYVISVTLAEAGKTRIMIQTVFLTTWWSWCLGACVAELIYYKKIAFKNNKLNRACCIAALLITLLICFLPKPYNLHAQRFVLPLAAAIFLYFLLLEEFYFIGSRYLVELGSISYSLYLLHPLAILVGVEVGLSFFYTTILVLLIGIFGAFLSYKFIEIPFVTLGSKVKI